MSASCSKLEKICAKNPTSILFARLAEAYLREGDIKRAADVCRKGLRYRPSYATGHVVMGKCHLEGGRLEEARQEFQKALQLDSDNLAAIWHLGRIDLQLGEKDLARGHFERALWLDPFNRELEAQAGVFDPGEVEQDSDPVEEAGEAGAEVFPEPAVETPQEPVVPVGQEADFCPGPADGASEEMPAVPDEEAGAEPPEAGAFAGEELTTLVKELQGGRLAPAPGGGQARSDVNAGIGAIATSTLAELYAAQGLIQQALAILESVSRRDPDNRKVKQRLEELRGMAGD